MSFTGVHSGHIIDLENMKPEDFRLDDIIWHLSRIARWCGGTYVPFSVLEHSLYCDDIYCNEYPFDYEDRKEQCREIRHPVAEAKEDRRSWAQIRLDILFHDAHEFILSDIPTGIKESIQGLRELIAKIDAPIRAQFGFDWEVTKVVKETDIKALVSEAAVLMPWEVYQRVKEDHGIMPEPVLPTFYGPEMAAMEFRSRVAELMEML